MESTPASTFSPKDNKPSQILTSSGFAEVYSDRFTAVYANANKGSIACVIKEEYVPIHYFQQSFAEISNIIKAGKYTKFIFDKRTLSTFHQPTMEWYFIHWKKDMLAFGLSQHMKILPDQEWFQKAVMIAKDDLMARYPDNIIAKLDIQYCNTLEEAIAR